MIAQSIRYWLADLITGGALTRARDDTAYANKHMVDGYYGMAEALKSVRSERDILIIDNTNGWHNSKHFEAALRTIAAMPTPSANATVRRMAHVAQEAVK